jgi:hypothetical protein
MRLNDDVELIDGMPAAFIRSLNSIVISDPHLGYEGVMAKRGMLIPKVNLKHLLEMLDACIRKTGADRLIIDGDIKNEFSTVETEELNELIDLLRFVKEKGIRLTIVKGNHDNFVERYKEPFKLEIHGQEFAENGYLFFHGEALPAKSSKTKFMIMGHEHPSIAVFNKAGKKEKLRCFLYGSLYGKKLLVIPASNYFASGTEINLYPKEELLSPVFKKANVDSMQAIAIGYGSTINFGSISSLRAL